jgi:hypothetical protein
MRRFISFTFAALLCAVVQGQDLIIQYDYLSKKTEYLKVNKQGDTINIKSPMVKKDGDVQLKVINFNEHALFVETEITNENIVESTNPFGLLNMLSPIFNVASKGVLTNMFDERGVDISSIEDEFGFTSDKTTDAQLLKAQNGFMNLNQKIYNLAQLEESIKNIEFGLNQLYLLSRNANLHPADIKEQARQIVSGTLKNGDEPELTSFYMKREQILKETKETLASAKILSRDINLYSKFTEKENFGFSNAENVESYEMLVDETDNLLQAVEEFESSYTKKEIEEMLQLMQQLYFSLQNSSFEYNTNAIAEGDRTNINLVFYDIPPVKTISFEEPVEQEEEEEAEEEEYDWETDFGYTLPNIQAQAAPKRTKSFKINVSGGFKITPSIGISFPTYFDKAKDYYARGDTTIVETDGDNFIPNISAFVNFYPYTGKAVNIGGSFGIGIPIKGATISPSFMLGPSIMLGNKYSIALSTGLSIGPIKKLENGFEVGQNLEIFQELKTTTKYAVGLYSSISFTIGVGN